MSRIFSGIQPTGDLHLGNYLGALKNWVNLQHDYECLYCVVDLHAITVWQEPDALAPATREVTAGLIASGLLASIEDPELRSALGRLSGEMEDAVTEVERIRSVFFSVHSPELGREGFDIAPITRLVEAGGEIQEGEPLPTIGQVRYPNRVTVRNHTRTRRVVVQGTVRGFGALAEELAAIEAQIAAYLST